MNRVAFVVIGRNEGERLGECLRSLLRHTNKIVYADSASTDGSGNLAQSLGINTVLLDQSSLLSAARARNIGFQRARSEFPSCEFVHFIDGDCVLVEGWLQKAVAFLDTYPRAAIVCGQRFEAHPLASPYNRMIDEEWNTPIGQADASGGDALVRVSAFEQIGGFNPALKAGEEPEMAYRLRKKGWEVWRLDGLMTEHDARLLHFGQWWARCLRGGFGYAEVWSLTRRVFRHQLSSALLWALGLPLLFLLFAAVFGEPLLLLAIPLVYLAQCVRLARRMGWRRAFMLMLAKLPEAIGALSYFMGRRPEQLANYKA
jgi:glycosyltransferase involved in cell wall biosynthesis